MRIPGFCVYTILGLSLLLTLDRTLAWVEAAAQKDMRNGAPLNQGKVISAEEQAGPDLGAKIASADAALGSTAGVIKISRSGQVSNEVKLSPHHGLVCDDSNVTLTLTSAKSGIVQQSDTVVRGCTMSSTLADHGAVIFAQGAANVQVDAVTFRGGGNHIQYITVSNFLIKNTRHLSVTTPGASPISVAMSSHGQIDSPRIEAYTVPAGKSGVRLIGIKESSFVDVINPVLNGVDASTVPGCGGVSFSSTTNSTLRGGQIGGLKNCDGVLTESEEAKPPSSDISITNTVSSGINASQGAGHELHNGEGIDIFNSRRVQLSQVTTNGNGTFRGMRMPGIEISNSIDITISGCIANGNGGEGIRVDGSPQVTIKDFHTNHNGASGILVMPAFGKVSVTHGSPMVKWAPGSANITFSVVWPPQTKIAIAGVEYTVAKFQNTGALTLTKNFTGASGAYGYNVDSYVELADGGSLDNGQRHKGEPPNAGAGEREGIYFSGGYAGELVGRITGLHVGDTQTQKTQIYGIRLENRTRIIASGVSASGNLVGGVRDSPGRSKIQTVR
jgi:parallel beta-helix repeat protein